MSQAVPLSPRSALRRRQSMSTVDDDAAADDAQHEVNIKDLGHYRTGDDSDDDPDAADARTPMIMDSETRSSQRDGLALQNMAGYNRLFYLTQGVGALLVLGIAFWLIKFLGGIGFSSPAIVFNFHPLFMITGFVFLYGNAICIYRTLRGELKPKLKLLHAILNGSVMFISFFGSLSVVYFHMQAGIPHFYSLHSWLGIVTWTLFTSQFVGGFATYLFPGASYNIRTLVMPFHRFIGVATFVLAAATCLTGLNEKAIFAFNGNTAPKYSDLPAAGVVVNALALILVAYVSLIVYLVTKPDFQRKPLPEESSSPTSSSPRRMSELNARLAP